MFDIDDFVHDNSLASSARWGGFPEFNFVGGHNDEELIPLQQLETAARSAILYNGKNLVKYNCSGPLGYLPLRKFIIEKLSNGAKMECSADDILIVSGSLQALDLVNATLLKPGDTVIVEECSYGGVFSRLQRLNITVKGVRVNKDGMDPLHLEHILIDLRRQNIVPRYIYTIPTIQNPTGTILSLEKRIKILQLSQKFNVPIFEDDCYADLMWGGNRPASIRSLDTEGRVIYCGSFSKSVAPALRVGYLVADSRVLSRILPYKTDGGSGLLEQIILAEFCKKNFYDHLEIVNKRLKFKSEVMCHALKKHFGDYVSYTKPDGGIYIWVRFVNPIDTYTLSLRALKSGVAINPGCEWSIRKDSNQYFRACFAFPSQDEINAGITQLSQIYKSEFNR